jgi:hypothetical protein
MSVKPSPAYIDQDRASVLLEKWGPVLDYTSDNVGAIENDHDRLNTAILLENQEAWCLNEANVASNGGVFGGGSSIGASHPNLPRAGDNYATGDARLPKILIPMIRRTFPELITNEIVGVQPMSGPVGLAFALRYKYEADALGGDRPCSDSDSTCADDPARGPADEREVGYNYLDTRFTGTSSAELTGNADFAFGEGDDGVANCYKTLNSQATFLKWKFLSRRPLLKRVQDVLVQNGV